MNDNHNHKKEFFENLGQLIFWAIFAAGAIGIIIFLDEILFEIVKMFAYREV